MLKLTSVARKLVVGETSSVERVIGTHSNKLEVSAQRLLNLLRSSEISRVLGKQLQGAFLKRGLGIVMAWRNTALRGAPLPGDQRMSPQWTGLHLQWSLVSVASSELEGEGREGEKMGRKERLGTRKRAKESKYLRKNGVRIAGSWVRGTLSFLRPV